MYKIVVGDISKSRLLDWFQKDENPYAVWEGPLLVSAVCNVASWRTADEFLRDHIDVDWGSVAWRADKQELTKLFSTCRWDVSKLQVLEDKKDYAVVFIESAGEF